MYSLIGCSSATEIITPTPEQITSSPDLSIVWWDDFEDGNLDGWETFYQGDFIVENGALSSSTGGDVYHLSSILFGTWSFDLHIDSSFGLTNEVQFTEGGINYQLLSIKNSPNTQIWVSTQTDPDDPITSYVDLGEKIIGWHHFDITKDESGWIKV